MSDLMLDVGQANELKLAFRRANWTNEDIKWLCQDNLLEDVRRVRHEISEIRPVHPIDCDATPYVPDGWKVISHQQGGKLSFDIKSVRLYTGDKQTKWHFEQGGFFPGTKLLEELQGKNVLNANVLDYLLEHQYIIPKDWKDKVVFFWGTLYTDSTSDVPCVRGCYWSGHEFSWFRTYVNIHLTEVSPAALYAW